jgi:hypothetical protein
MPSETLSRTASSPASTQEVWRSLQSPGTWEGIPGVDEVTEPRHDENGRLSGFDFVTRVGGRAYRGTAARLAGVEGESMGWDVKTPELVGSVEVAIRGDGNGTDVTVTLTFASVGMMSSMFFPVIVSSIGSEFPSAVDRFARGLGAS